MDYNLNVSDFVERYINKQNMLYNHTYALYDPPVWEYNVKGERKAHLSKDDVAEMIFIYFTVTNGVEGEKSKRYYQIVTGCFGIEIYYNDENVIPINMNYPLSDVRFKFTNWCKYMLEKLGENKPCSDEPEYDSAGYTEEDRQAHYDAQADK